MNLLSDELLKIVDRFPENQVTAQYRAKISENDLTKDENIESHICILFAAYDSVRKQIFIGHHKKSGIWLFNGGHVKCGEILTESVSREIEEEWGMDSENFTFTYPDLLTVTDIDNPKKQSCVTHYDIWYFIDVSMIGFSPKEKSFSAEFYEMRWVSIDTARDLPTSKSMHEAFDYLEHKMAKDVSADGFSDIADESGRASGNDDVIISETDKEKARKEFLRKISHAS